MDIVGYDESVFTRIRQDFLEFASELMGCEFIFSHQRTRRRQRGEAGLQHALVQRPQPVGISRNGAVEAAPRTVRSVSGSVRDPAEPRFSWFADK